jgi:tripartite-type tricarboxylate transporter receptor subunit TctC
MLAALCTAFSVARAQPLADQALKIVVGFAPGGAADNVARSFAEQLRQDGNGPIIVENKPGASARIALDYVKLSKPDGQTIFLGPSPLFTVFPLTYKQLTYDADRDLVPVSVMTDIPTAIAAGVNQPYKTMNEYVQWIKQNPSKANIGLATVGNTLQLGTFAIGQAVGVDIPPVAYKGASPMLIDVASGLVSIGADALASQMPLYKAGKINILGVSGSVRAQSAPEIPTMLEQGFNQYLYATSWYGAFVPTATPMHIRTKLEMMFTKAAQSPTLIKNLGSVGLEVIGGSGALAFERIKNERTYWAPVVKASGISLND